MYYEVKVYFSCQFNAAILTFGAVSASEDADNLTAVDDDAAISADDVAETVSQVEEVDSIAGDGSGDEVISVGEQEASYDEIIPEDIRIGDDWAEEYERATCVGVIFYDEDISGDVEFYVDNELKSTQSAKCYYVDWDDRGVHFDLLENDVGVGMHDITIKYLGDDKYAPFDINGQVEVYYMKADIPETVVVGEWVDSFRLIFSLDATGFVDIYIDGENVATYDIYDERYDGEFDWICPSFTVDVAELTNYGEHDYEVRYYGGNYGDKTLSGSFNLDYKFDVEQYDDLLYGDSIEFYVYLPQTADGTIALTVNGKHYEMEADGYYNIFKFTDLVYGETDFIFSYQDNNYPEKTVTVSRNIIGGIKFNTNDGDVPYNSKDNNVTLMLPSNANGNLTVYKRTDETDENGDYIFEIVDNVKLQNGIASVSVSDWGVGSFYILVKYTGEDYPVDDGSWDFEICPNVDYPNAIWNKSNEEYKIIIKSPEDIEGDMSVLIRNSEPTGYEEVYNEEWGYSDYVPIYDVNKSLYEGEAKGTVTISLLGDEFNYPDLKKGKYSLIVQYGNIVNSYDIMVSDKNPEWTIEVIVPKEVAKGDEKYEDYEFWPNAPSDDGDAWIILYIDGKSVTGRMIDDDGEFEYSICYLDIGTHTWKVTYTGSSYYSDASAEGTFEVVWITIPEEVIDGVTIVDCHMDEDATGYISLSIDGKDYAMEFVEDGYASFELANLTLGEHTYEFIYSGDENHEQLTKTGSFNNTMKFEMNDWLDYDDMSIYAESYPVSFELPSDATGTIILTVGDKTYTQDVVDGEASFEITGLDLGQYKLVAVYSGDDKYPKREISKEFEIFGYGMEVEYPDDDDLDSFISVSITLPRDATGSLVLYKEEYDDEMEEYTWVPVKTVELVNGKAMILASDLKLPIGYYEFKAVYEGSESYSVGYKWLSLSIRPIINVPESVNIGEDATIEIDLGEATGSIIISVNGDEFKTVELENGKINVAVPSDILTDEENIVTFRYEGDDLDWNPFGYYDDDDEFVPNEYTISVELKKMEIPSDFAADGTGNITFELPEGSSGNVTVYVDDDEVSTTPVTGGTNTIPVSGLSTGDHTIRVVYEDENGKTYSTSSDVNVPKPEPEMEITTPTDSTTPEFSINLPEDATGSLIVNVDGKNYAADLVGGKATVSVPDLEEGTYDVTVKYTGDKNYTEFTKKTTVTVKYDDVPPVVELIDPNLTISVAGIEEGSDALVLITTNDTFTGDVKVRIGDSNYTVSVVNGKGNVSVSGLKANDYTAFAIFDQTSVFKASKVNTTFTVKAKEDSGSKTPAKKADKITLKLKKVKKVKRSAKKLVIKATLKINGKAVKGKKLKFKFNKKTYTAKTDKKGVAKIKVTKKVLKKLKVGKKITIKVSYGKKTAKQKIKVKK